MDIPITAAERSLDDAHGNARPRWQHTALRLILASGSPRRAALLRQVGLEAVVSPPVVDETPRLGERPPDLAARLANLKARTVATRHHDGSHIVVAADTVVDLDGMALGKPRDRRDAIGMLVRLGGREHRVWTGVVASRGRQTAHALVGTSVRLGAISPEMAAAYWNSGEPADKAGGYAIQGRGAMFVESLNGSYSNVVGLPLFETLGLLRGLGLEWPARD